MVEDPFLFGKIAAANAFSDIYAMGGRPLFALNLVCFPEKAGKDILGHILAGGAAKALEAGVVIAGGHSIYDHEPKYGLAVTGLVDTARVLRNGGCKDGDALILTKPLGTGLIMAAFRAGEAGEGEFKAAADCMERLNRAAAEKFSPAVHGCTDVTGFGLAVHALEMAGTDHTLNIDAASLPLLDGALYFAGQFYATAGGQRNRNYMEGKADLGDLSPAMQEIVFDPQTSGGLLISVSAGEAETLLGAIRRDDPRAAIVGEVTARERFPVVFV